MARSPRFVPPPGMEDKALAGVRSCGCITAAQSISPPPGLEGEAWAWTTEKDVREFYAEMAGSGREVRWMDIEELRSKLGSCKCDAGGGVTP